MAIESKWWLLGEGAEGKDREWMRRNERSLLRVQIVSILFCEVVIHV
jgi:hypothetical protein